MLKLTDTCVWPGEILYFDLDTLRHFRACADGAIVAIDAFGTLERTKLTEPVIGAFWAQAVWTNQLVTLNNFIRWWIQQFQQEAPLLADIYPTKVVNGWVKLLAEYDKRFSTLESPEHHTTLVVTAEDRIQPINLTNECMRRVEDYVDKHFPRA